MYGAQTLNCIYSITPLFENDVEMYGAQTLPCKVANFFLFENDVEMYGAQTVQKTDPLAVGLRMM